MAIRYLSGINVDSNTLFVDDVNNRVGIGTGSPAYTLHVNLNATGYIARIQGSTNNISFYDGGSGGIGIGTDVNQDLKLYTNDTLNNGIVIKPSGNVGIGTTAPGGKLEINHTAVQGATALILRNSGTINANGTIRWQNNAGTNQAAIGSYYNVADAGAIEFLNGNTTNVIIRSSGNVGIGTTSPVAALHVQSSATKLFLSNTDFNTSTSTGSGLILHTGASSGNTYGQIYAFQSGNTSYANLVIPGGNVGIGNTAPSQKLHVTGNVRVTGAYYDSNNEAGTSGQVLTSTGTGTDWKSLAEITGVDGTGTANYVAKWSDTDTITNSQIQDNGTTVGVGTAPSSAKLTVAGSINAGGKAIYTKTYGSIDTTGQAVAGISASTNGQSALFQFTCNGGSGEYQKIIYACHNVSGTWFTRKVVDEGTNALDVVASANGATITFTFKGRTASQVYSPRVLVEITGNLDSSYL